MKGFIEIKTSGGNTVLLNVSTITSVKQCKGCTYIYIIGDDEFYRTDESYNTVVNNIKSALRMCEYENEKQDH